MHQLAVGADSSAKTGTYLPNYTLLSGFHVDKRDKELLQSLAGRSLDREFEAHEETVQFTRLDEWLRDNDIEHIDLLKIDVEKSELDVILSLGDAACRVSAVIAEVHEANREALSQPERCSRMEFGTQHVYRLCAQSKALPTENDLVLHFTLHILLFRRLNNMHRWVFRIRGIFCKGVTFHVKRIGILAISIHGPVSFHITKLMEDLKYSQQQHLGSIPSLLLPF